MTSNDKEKVRHRRQRNLVAKNNKHKGGYHSSVKFERQRKLVIDRGGISMQEINEWWESNV